MLSISIIYMYVPLTALTYSIYLYLCNLLLNQFQPHFYRLRINFLVADLPWKIYINFTFYNMENVDIWFDSIWVWKSYNRSFFHTSSEWTFETFTIMYNYVVQHSPKSVFRKIFIVIIWYRLFTMLHIFYVNSIIYNIHIRYTLKCW